MDSAGMWSLIGAGVGSLIGVAGGLYGTWCSIKSARPGAERQFMIRASVVMWCVLGVFLGLLLLVPSPWMHLLWLPYGIGLPLGIRFINRRQQELRVLGDLAGANDDAG